MVWGKKTVNGGRLWRDGHSWEEGVQTAVIWGPRCPLAVIPGSGRLPRSALAAVRGRAAWPGTNNLPVARQRRATGRRVTTSGRAGVAGRTESPAAPRFVDIARQPLRQPLPGQRGPTVPCLKEAGTSPGSREETRELQGEKNSSFQPRGRSVDLEAGLGAPPLSRRRENTRLQL